MGFNKSQFMKTVAEFNAAAGEIRFDPMIKDGKHTSGLAVDKTNWAQRIDQAPYVAYPVTTGITFTFGGLGINGNAQVQTSQTLMLNRYNRALRAGVTRP